MGSKQRVVVTGLGMVGPVGLNVKACWEHILAGKSGIRTIEHFDASQYPCRIGGSVWGFAAADCLPPKDARKMDPFIHYGVVAAKEAIADAGLEVTQENAFRIGVAIGSGIGGLPGIEKGYDTVAKEGPRKLSPFFIPSNIINMIAGHVSIMHGFQGPNIAIVSACTTGTHNIGEAMRMIQHGTADVMVAGGAEMATSPSGLAGFAAARALSTRNDDPATASRPFDKDRDGFVMGDGAGVVVLEEYEHAKRRGAKIYCELIGYGLNSDAYHITMPSEGGEGAKRCMQLALGDARIDPTAVHYINAHGTSTPAGDKAETLAVKAAFGAHAYELAMSSTKSMTGHLLGAAGGVEAIFSILAIHDQVAPPTINQFTPDPDCDLDYVPNTAREMNIDVALSNSFGFGGTNGTLVFSKLR